MIEVPEPETELKPIPKPPYKPTIDDKPMKVPGMVMGSESRKPIKDIILDAIRHFITGFTLAGGPALAATIAAGASLTGPVGWTVLALAIVSGAVEAGRKTTKTIAADTGKKDWIYFALNLLEIILTYLKTRYEKKSANK